MRAALIAAVLLALPALAAPNFGKLNELLGSPERDQRREASHQLRSLGAGAKPMLAQLIAALGDSDPQVFADVTAAIAEIGPDAKDAVPRLIEITDSRKGRGFRPRDREQASLRASFALSKIGAAARPELISALKSDDTGIRRGAAKALGMMGVDAKDAVPGLIENLGHADELLRADAVEALALIGDAAVGPLVSSLGWPDPRLREGSARALGELGRAAGPASGPLLRAASDEKDESVLAAIVKAIPRTGAPHQQCVPVLVKALCDGREPIRRAAVNAFVFVRPPGDVAVPALVKLLDGPNAGIAAETLGYFGGGAKAAAPALLTAAKRITPPSREFLEPLTRIGAPAISAIVAEIAAVPLESVSIEHWAVESLDRIGGAGVPALEKELTSPSASVRVAAVMVLSRQGSSARSVHNGILKLAGDSEATVRAAVLRALDPLGVAPGRSIELISQLVKDRDPGVRAAAAVAAGALGNAGRPLADELATLVEDSDSAVRVAAMKSIGSVGGGAEAAKLLASHLADAALRPAVLDALSKFGPASAPAVPQLVALLEKSEPDVRVQVFDVLANAGNDGRAGLPAIEAALKDANDQVRAAALRAFGQLAADRDSAVKAGIAALADESRTVRESAAGMLGRIGEQSADRVVSAVVPLIELHLRESEPRYVMEALRSCRVRDEASIARAFATESDDLRMWACERAARNGKAGAVFMPELEKLRASGNDGLRNAARRAMDSIRR